MPRQATDHQPATRAMPAAERADLLRMLDDIGAVELSLDTEHVTARGMHTPLVCTFWSDDAPRSSGYGLRVPEKRACAFESLKAVSV
jgi:hypothetical protein